MIDLLEEHFRLLIHKELPFVVYRKPSDTKLVSINQQDKKLNHLTDYSETGFVFAPFDNKKKAVIFPLKDSKVEELEYSAQVQKLKFKDVPFSEEDKTNHISLVEKGIDAISKSEMRKVVLSRKHTSTITTHLSKAFKRMLAQYPNAFVYCWCHPKEGTWLGATPETLLNISNRKLETIALAGTQKYKGTTDVKWGAKEIEEQQLVTDSIAENLAPFSANTLTIDAPQTNKAGNLLHIKTTIKAIIEDQTSIQEIVKALHPTPAICGLPKNKAQKFIEVNEGYDREFYTGFLGELNFAVKRNRATTRRNIENLAYRHISRQTNLFVNLRCMQWKGEKAHLYVGGGITKSSDPNAEWEETQNKLQTMLSVL